MASIEGHYGRLDNLGDPFCDVARIQEVRFDWLVIAEVGEEYAGFLYWHLGEKPFFAPEIARFAHIREVQVVERFQGRGVGRKLMIYALERLKALGIQDIFLATAETNEAARHLYESLGFTQFRKQIEYALRVNDQPEDWCVAVSEWTSMGRIGLRGFESPSHQTKVSSNVPKRFLSPDPTPVRGQRLHRFKARARDESEKGGVGGSLMLCDLKACDVVLRDCS